MIEHSIRQCANKKSVKYPDIKCNLKATHGEFCYRHYKNPKRFRSNSDDMFDKISKKQEAALIKIKKFWKFWQGLIYSKRHGPAVFVRSLSQNSTEVTSMEDIEKVKTLYFFSYKDNEGKIWSFDIRSLVGILSHNTIIENPYTRAEFTVSSMKRLHACIDWLRKRKFMINYSNDVEITEEQLWNQKVLDVFLGMDKLGFNTNLDWFFELKTNQHKLFFKEIYVLWANIPLTPQQKLDIVPADIFKYNKYFSREYDLRWWQDETLRIIKVFSTNGLEESYRSSGALYVIRCLCYVSDSYNEAYSWVNG